MARIAILVGHVKAGSFCEALGESYARGAAAAGHETQLFVTGKMTFDPILHECFDRVQTLEPDLQRAHDALLAADHLVFIFPLWMGTLPAILKGFLERVFQAEMVEASRKKKFVRLLKGTSARVILTMGMPGFVYRWWFGAHALKMLKHNILRFMGVWPIRSTIYGNIEGVGAKGRGRWLKQVEGMGRRGI
jgi:putative NADPH-quinone reductase